ncbi:hypothetical protein AMQ83_29025 [Paenibacillus riograndensis]|nr:hypothetical protein AMQ83_29025 [Paenibacillus riograndensis]
MDVQYSDDASLSFIMQNEAGIIWTLDLDSYENHTLYSPEILQGLRDIYNGLPVWDSNSEILDSPFKNMEKVTVKDFRSNPNNGNLEVIIRQANINDDLDYVVYGKIRFSDSRCSVKNA